MGSGLAVTAGGCLVVCWVVSRHSLRLRCNACGQIFTDPSGTGRVDPTGGKAAWCTTGEDILKPYKETLDRWLWPDVLRDQDTSVVKTKQAISSYKEAVGDPAGLTELMAFTVNAAGFCNDVGYQDDAYFDALVRMFEQALKTLALLSASGHRSLITRLDKVRTVSHNFGYGVSDDMDSLIAKYPAQ